MTLLTRALGALTALYGGYTLLRPATLVGQLHTDRPDTARTAARVIGVRDLLSGTAMLTAPAGTGLRIAVAARVAADASDALLLARLSPEPARRTLVRVVALGWGAVCGLAGVAAAREARR